MRLDKLFEASAEHVSVGFYDRPVMKHVRWRHDVDVDLTAALIMARYEACVGIRSTYFFRTEGPYNIWSREFSAAVSEIDRLGHWVGLHCNLKTARDAVVKTNDVHALVASDFYSAAAASPVRFRKVVSFHCPPENVLRRTFTGFVSAYQDEFMTDYYSDSGAPGGEGNFERLEKIDWQSRSIQINLHPVWWFGGKKAREAASSLEPPA